MQEFLVRAIAPGLIVGGLFLMDTHSSTVQAQPVAADAQSQAAVINPAQLQSPDELRRLCDLVRKRNGEIDQRHHAQLHTEVSINIEFDKQGQTTLRERKTEQIRYDGSQEYRLVQKYEDLISGRDRTPAKQKEIKAPKLEAIFPLGANEPPNSYTYTYAGAESVDDRPTLRIAYEPTEPLENKFRGNVWIDPQTYEPVRFIGAWAQPPRFVYEMSMQLDWGRSESGPTQLRRSVVAGSGGLALFQKRFRIETDLVDYRPPTGR